MYICKWFVIQEFVPPSVFDERGAAAWELMDDRLLRACDMLRDRFGAATINNWHLGGARHWSGLRTPDSSYYRKYSQHSFGRAADLVFRNIDAESVRLWINETFCEVNAIEAGVSWVHIDVRNCKRLKVFKQ